MEQFLSDTGAALLAAAVVATVVWIFNRIRSHRLESALAEALSTNGVSISYGDNKASAELLVQVGNGSSATVRVRSFVIVTDSVHVSLAPRTREAESQNPLDNAVLQPDFPRRALSRGTVPDDEIAGTMLLPPMTMGWWKVPRGVIGERKTVAHHAYLVFEYPSLFGHSTLVRIKVDGARFRLIKEQYELLNTCAFDGVPMPLPWEVPIPAVRG